MTIFPQIILVLPRLMHLRYSHLDIMGVNGYELLALPRQHHVVSAMLTARALTPEDVKNSYIEGASFYIPKEEMLHIDSFLEKVPDALEKGKEP